MKHYRRNAWTPWLWGQVRWWGTGAPWERSPTLCSNCGQQHGASVQSRLAYCPAWDLWRRSWTDWAQHACQWLETATSLELWLCARLLIPLSLINAIPTRERHKLRAEVGLFQFRMIQAIQTLRRKFTDPTPQQAPSPLWLTRFVAQTLPPRETAQNLRNQVGAPMRCDRKRKRRAEPATTEPIDPELWLRDAHVANNDEAVAWFANIHETGTLTQEERTQKHRRLDGDTRRWEHYLTASNKLAKQHAQRAQHAYCSAHASEVTRRHLYELRTLYANTLTAKTEYHLLVSNLIKEHIEAQRLHNTYTTMCLERRQWYEQGKQDTVKWYADLKTSHLTYARFERLCTDTNLLGHHMQQAHYTWRQQEHIMNLTQGFNNSCQQKTTLYWDASRQARQTIYLIRKRPREQWDPTLWEVPLQPLPKRHKAHWDPTEWEIPLT